MRQLQPVLWTKGTLLSPQHLQTQDRFLEEALQFRLESLSFCPWGFLELRLDRDALAAGMLAISTACGILPDGLPFDIPNSDPAPPPRPLAALFQGSADPAVAFLAIPSYRRQGANVSGPDKTAETRYVADITMVADEVLAGSEKPVPIARKGFRLLFETESRQGQTCLPLARLRPSAAGIPEPDERFVPPLLDIAASDSLMTIARRLLEILTAKSSELSALRRQKNQSLADFTASDIASFWLLHTINSYYPVLRHLFEVKRGHPADLYGMMLEFAGALTTFSTEVHPRDLPAYDHEHLGDCFRELDEKTRLLLETVVPRNFVSLALKQVQPSIYATSLADDRYLRNTRLYLAIRADMNHGDLIAKGPQLIKVGSASQIDQLVRHALPGVEFLHVVRPPSSLPVKLDYEYFSLVQSGPVWDTVVRARNLAAYVPGEFPSAELEVMILLPEAAAAR